MGLLDKLKKSAGGTLSSVAPADGVAPAARDGLVARLQAIEGPGIETAADGDTVVVAWTASIATSNAFGTETARAYRAIRLELDASAHEAKGICVAADSDSEFSLIDGPRHARNAQRGQLTGIEEIRMIAPGGTSESSGAADATGFRFSWSQLREPVIEAVTGAGWTYKPKMF